MPVNGDTSNVDWWKLAIQGIGYAVTWTIVFVGWSVNSKQNDRRDTRKEVRETVDAAISSIREVEGRGVEFLSGNSSDDAIYWAIYFAVQRVLPAVEQLPLPNHSDVAQQLVAFRKLMTSQVINGPDSPFPDQETRRRLLLAVSRGANRFVSVIEDGYRRRYPVGRHR